METARRPAQVDLAVKALKALSRPRRTVAPTAWLDDFRKNPDFFGEIKGLVGAEDAFGVEREAAGLRKLLDGKKDFDVLVCLASYMERIDSHLSMLQLRRGDRADVLQNVHWQRDLLLRLRGRPTDARRTIDEVCTEFIRAWEAGKAGARTYRCWCRRSGRPSANWPMSCRTHI